MLTGNRNFIFYKKNYINNRENLRKIPIDLSIKNKQIAFCPNLPFGILSLSSYLDIASMNIISSNVEMNEYKILGNKSKQVFNVLKILRNAYFFRIFTEIKERRQIKI